MSRSMLFPLAAAAAMVSAVAVANADPCRADEVSAFLDAHGVVTKGLELTPWKPGAGQSGATFCRAFAAGRMYVVKYFQSPQQCESEDGGYRDALADQGHVMAARAARSAQPTGTAEVPAFVRHIFAAYLGKGPAGTCAFTVSALAPGSRVSDQFLDPSTAIRTAEGVGTYLGLAHRKTASPDAMPLSLDSWIAINPPDASLTNLLWDDLSGLSIVDWSQRGTGTRTVAALLASIMNQIGMAALAPSGGTFDANNPQQLASLMLGLRVANAFWLGYAGQVSRPVKEPDPDAMDVFEGVDNSASMSNPLSQSSWDEFLTALARFKVGARASDPLQQACMTYKNAQCNAVPASPGGEACLACAHPELCIECSFYLQ